MLNIKNKLHSLKSEIDSAHGQLTMLTGQINTLQSKLTLNIQNKELYSQCVEVLNIIQQQLQEKTKSTFEQVVTNALKNVFKKEFNLKLEFDRRGSTPELNVIVQNADMKEADDLENSNSGMALDLIHLALRLIILNFINQTNAPLFLDEVFAQADMERKISACTFIKQLAEKFNRQILLINHVSGAEEKKELELIADNVIQIGA